MSEPVIVAICSLVSGLVGTAITAYISHRQHRFTEAEIIQDALADNQKLWLWNRHLVDHIYKGLGPPPPEPPAQLFEHNH